MSHTGNASGNFGQQSIIYPLQKLWSPTMLGSDFYAGFNAKDSGNLIITSGNSVDSWIDFSRNGRDVFSASAKPIYNPSRFLGNPCVVFNNSPMDSFKNLPAGTTYSWLCLVKDSSSTSTLGEPFSIGTSLSSASLELVLNYGFITPNPFSQFNGAILGTASGGTAIRTIPTLIGVGLQSGIGWARTNGINGTNGGSSVNTASALFRLGGSRPQATSNPYPLNGDLYCFVAIASSVGSANFLKTEGWIAWEFKMQSILPSFHPYRYRPPSIGD